MVDESSVLSRREFSVFGRREFCPLVDKSSAVDESSFSLNFYVLMVFLYLEYPKSNFVTLQGKHRIDTCCFLTYFIHCEDLINVFQRCKNIPRGNHAR